VALTVFWLQHLPLRASLVPQSNVRDRTELKEIIQSASMLDRCRES
jgi:hypothetical protein